MTSPLLMEMEDDDFAIDVALVDLLVGFVFAGDTKTAAVFRSIVLFRFFVVGGVVVVSAGGLVDDDACC